MIELGGFLGLAGLMIGLFAWLRQDVDGLRREVNGLRDEVGRLRGEINEIRGEIRELRECPVRLEDPLEGLREAISGRHAA